MGNSLALYNPPVRVAEEFAMLDCLSGGRLVAGFPVGTSMDTNFCYGETPATLREKYYEAHDLIVRAWTDPSVFTFNGKYTQLRYVNIWPRPVQQPHPPIWIPGGGSIETWEWTSKMNYVYAYLSYSGWQRGKFTMDGYWKAMEKIGGDDNPHHAGFLQLVCVSESEEQAEKDYAEHGEYFYDKCLHVWNGFADAPGYRTVNTLRAGFGAQVGSAATQARKGLTWRDLVDGGYVVAGSPEQVTERMAKVITELRVGQLMVLCQIGSMPPELVRKNTELFAREVMPHLRGFWSEYPDNWSPKPLTARAEPAPVAEPVAAR
jgi:alkanesulfonate monooxygenase SsuD/methylene tetrahydromethanopterin reductase-like flavin-dependent oxidoreductase (luciferase family)